MTHNWNSPPNRLVSIINDMPQDEFKAVTERLLKEMRFKISNATATGKYLEFEATREGEELDRVYLIRAARGQKRITPEELQATVGKKKGAKDMSPVYISTGGFTEEAGKYAELLNVSLADGDKLMLLLRKFNMEDDLEKSANRRVVESEGDRFLPSIDELENCMRWGNDFYHSGNYRKAIEYYDSAIRLKTQYDLAWLMKGNALSALGAYDEAIESFEKVLEYNPASEEAWYNLGATLYHMGRYEDEIACYDKALELRPEFAKAWNNKGTTLYELGKYEEAVMCYDRVLKTEPDNVSALNNRGVALKKLKNHDEALKSFDRAVKKKEDYTDAWLNRGILLQEMARNQEAIDSYDKVLTKWKSPEVLCQKGTAQTAAGQYRQAIESFDESLAMRPEWSVALEEKAKAEALLREAAAAEALRAGEEAERRRPAPKPAPEPETGEFCEKCGAALKPEARFCSGCGTQIGEIDETYLPAGMPAQLEAIEEQEALQRALDREEYLVERARSLRSNGRAEEALKSMEEALGISERAENWLEMGNVLAAMNRWDDAIEAYDRVLRTDPESFLGLSNKEAALVAIEELEAALEVNGRITVLEPEWLQAWVRRAVIFSRLGQHDKAVICLDRAADIAPGLAEVWNTQGAALMRLNKLDDTILCLDRAIQIDPDFAEAWTNKGAAMAAAGKNSKSLQYFDRAIDIDPENANAWANKGSALYNMDRFSEAVECFDEALSLRRTKEVLNSKGWALLGDDNPAAAIESFDDAIAIDQNYAEAWNNRGLAYSRKGDGTEAFDSFDRALAIAPDFADAKKNRDAAARRIEQATGKKPEAKEPKPSTRVRGKPEFEEAVKAAEKLEAEEIETEEFRCPHCNALGSVDDVFCEKCGQKFSVGMKEDAAEQKLEHILDTEEKPKAEKKKPAKKSRDELIEDMITIPGVGLAKAGLIIDAGYDTEAKLRKAEMEDLANISGIGEGLARKLKRKYR